MAGSPPASMYSCSTSTTAGMATSYMERSGTGATTPVGEMSLVTGLPRTAIAAKLAIARERDWLEPGDDWMRPTELGRRFANDAIGLFLD